MDKTTTTQDSLHIRLAIEIFQELDKNLKLNNGVLQRAVIIYARTGASERIDYILAAAWLGMKLELAYPPNVYKLIDTYNTTWCKVVEAERDILAKLDFRLWFEAPWDESDEPLDSKKLLDLGKKFLAKK